MIMPLAVGEKKANGLTMKQSEINASADKRTTITGENFTEKLGSPGIFSIVRTGSMVWQHGSFEDLLRMNFPKSVEAFGAQLCSEKTEKLEALESLIAQRTPFIERGIHVRDKNKKIDRDYYVQYDQARFEYRSLLLDIIIGAVNAARREKDPSSRGFVLNETDPLLLGDLTILPHDSFTISDEDIKTPAMTLYLQSDLAAFQCILSGGNYGQAFQAELAVQMKIHEKLVYQGMAFNGVVARTVCTRVSRLSDLFAGHKTDFDMATYSFPEHRNGFVADMVNLLQNHADHRQVYINRYMTNRWDFDKHRMVEA